jgi:hypothetical protein
MHEEGEPSPDRARERRCAGALEALSGLSLWEDAGQLKNLSFPWESSTRSGHPAP